MSSFTRTRTAILRRLLPAALGAATVLVGGCRFLSWSPDGRSIAFDQGGRLRVFDTQTGRFRSHATRAGKPVGSTYSPDGKQVAYFVAQPEGADLYVRDLGSGRERRILSRALRGDDPIPDDPEPARKKPDAWAPAIRILSAITWHPSGKRLAFGTDHPRDSVAIVELSGGKKTVLRGSLPAWSPDGRRLAFLTSASDARGDSEQVSLQVAEFSSLRARTVWKHRQPFAGPEPFTPMWSPASDAIVVASRQPPPDEGESRWTLWRVPLHGARPSQWASFTGRQPALSADLRSLAFLKRTAGGRSTLLYATHPFTSPRELSVLADQPIFGPGFSPDGRRIGLLCAPGERLMLGLVTLPGAQKRLWDVTTGQSRDWRLLESSRPASPPPK